MAEQVHIKSPGPEGTCSRDGLARVVSHGQAGMEMAMSVCLFCLPSLDLHHPQLALYTSSRGSPAGGTQQPRTRAGRNMAEPEVGRGRGREETLEPDYRRGQELLSGW